MSFFHDQFSVTNNNPLIYQKDNGEAMPAPLIEPFGIYYCKDAGGNEWALKSTTGSRWLARFEEQEIESYSFARTVLIVLEQNQQRITVRVTCDTGKTWVTDFNGTLEGARDYFLGAPSVDEWNGVETHNTVIGVVQV
jgi:hypothetical protein